MNDENKDVGTEWKGFRERQYNWCIMVYEHWVCPEEKHSNTFGANLDGTSECFMRVYLTRFVDYSDSLAMLSRRLKKWLWGSDNWYELKVFKGNTRGAPIAIINIKPDTATRRRHGYEE